MKIVVVYIHVMNIPEYDIWTDLFINSYKKCPPGEDHETLIVCNNGPIETATKERFSCFPNASFMQHNNDGWDIGGYIQASRIIDCDMAVYFCGTGFVQHPNWLKRMMDVWWKHGPGLYGSLGTWERSPHLNTTGFWCHPEMMRQYPLHVSSKAERYDFEHGPNAFWKIVHRAGFPVLMATWCGEYNWQHWRLPPNIYRRGDQSNCVTFFRHSIMYATAPPQTKSDMEASANWLSDPEYIQLLQTGKVP